MKREDIRIRANTAAGLAENEAFQAFIREVRESAIAQFLNSGPADAGTREEAHGLIRAINALEATIKTAIDAEKIEQRKEQDRHRGND